MPAALRRPVSAIGVKSAQVAMDYNPRRRQKVVKDILQLSHDALLRDGLTTMPHRCLRNQKVFEGTVKVSVRAVGSGFDASTRHTILGRMFPLDGGTLDLVWVGRDSD